MKKPVPDGTTLSQLEDLFKNIKSEIRLLNKDSAPVMVKWTDKNNRKDWKPGWYTAIIKNYMKVCDVIEIEYVSEPGKCGKWNPMTPCHCMWGTRPS